MQILENILLLVLLLKKEKQPCRNSIILMKITQNIQQRITESSSSLQLSNILVEASRQFGADIANMTRPDFR